MQPSTVDAVFAHVSGQPRSCTAKEYRALALFVRAMSPCKLLVFGVGRDSAAWITTNEGGQSLFIENSQEWIDQITLSVRDLNVVHTNYDYRFEAWQADNFELTSSLNITGLSTVSKSAWDVVFVDAPLGPKFGRQQSSFMATQFVRPGGLVALHDCERAREQAVCRYIFDQLGYEVLLDVERLRIYKAPTAGG